MDKNTVLGMVLMALVLFGFMYCNRPEPSKAEDPAVQEQAERARALQAATDDSLAVESLTPEYYQTVLAAVESSDGTVTTKDVDLKVTDADTHKTLSGTVVGFDVAAVFNPDDTSLTFRNRVDAAAALRTAIGQRADYAGFAKFISDAPTEPFTINSPKMAITFDPRGGRMSRIILNDYANEYSKDHNKVRIMGPGDSYAFLFHNSDGRVVSTEDMTFTPSVSQDSLTVTMKLEIDPSTWMAFTYTLDTANYVVHLDITQKNMSSVVQRNSTGMQMNWQTNLERNEIGRTFEERNSAIFYKMKEDNPDDLSAHEADTEKLTGAVKWVAFKNQFFSSVVIPRNAYFTNADLSSTPYKRDSAEGAEYLKKMVMDANFAYNPSADGEVMGFDFYLGPNSYPGLCDVSDVLSQGGEDLQLNKLVYLGWGLFGWINRFIVIPIFNFLGSFLASYGIIILILTIIIKIILFPFTYKSYMSQAKMRVLAPEIKEINEKYPGQENAMKRQQETMKLYSKAGASPFSGCLPMLLQLPVLIALFSFFPSAIELRGQSFLWVHNLAAPDYICTLPFTIPFYGNQVSLFCLLMTVTNIIYTRISMASNPSAGMSGMKWMTYLMPIMFLFFFNDYAAGLSYYYFVSLLITIIQTYVCRKIVSEDKVRAQMIENTKKPKKKKGFMARLEAAQKRQEAMMREQAKQRAKKRR